MPIKINVKKPNNIKPLQKVIPTINNVNIAQFLDLYFTIKVSPETYNKMIHQ
jgi:hypothetical protein